MRSRQRGRGRRGEGKAWSACLQFELYLLSTLTLNEAGISPPLYLSKTTLKIASSSKDRTGLGFDKIPFCLSDACTGGNSKDGRRNGSLQYIEQDD